MYTYKTPDCPAGCPSTKEIMMLSSETKCTLFGCLPFRFAEINLIFAHFTEEEMSSDETEIEKGFGAPKLLRRIRKLWMNPELTMVCLYVILFGSGLISKL